VAPSRKLAAEWAVRLREDGLLPCGYWDNQIISSGGSGKSKTADAADRQRAKARYTDFAADVLRYHHFANRRDRQIWELHASGLGVRGVAKAIGWTFNMTLKAIARIRAEAIQAAKSPDGPDLHRAIRDWVANTDPRTLLALAGAFATVRAQGHTLTAESLADAATTPEQRDLLRPEERGHSNWLADIME
jgi:hypothetical protein